MKRMTPIRKKILQIFASRKKPVATMELQAILRKNFPKLNKSTLYRQIQSLKDEGQIKEIQFINEKEKRYELADMEHHHHLICVECGHVEDVEIDDVEKILEEKQSMFAKSKKFFVMDHSLEFWGKCLNCK